METSILLIFQIIILLAVILIVLILWAKNRTAYQIRIEDIALSPDDLRRHAENLAKSHKAAGKKNCAKSVRKRAEANYQKIFETYQKFSQDHSAAFPIPPAAEWLLDNFYIIEEQKNVLIKELGESRQQFPMIIEGIYTGYPRVFAIAVEIVSHVDGNINEKTIKEFIDTYQKYTFLSIEELWMLPLMVKAALFEKLGSVCDKTSDTRQDWYRAEHIVKEIAGTNSDCEDFKEYIKTIDELTPAFVEHLIKKLRKSGSKTLWMVECLDSLLVQKSTSTDILISQDHYNQASYQVSMGNVINSFRNLSGLDSRLLFDMLSEVERILQQDPSGVYSEMDFPSRNYYRNLIIALANKYKTTEINIARLSCQLANASSSENPELSPNNHVGYYIAGKGREALLELANSQLSGKKRSGSSNAGLNASKIYIYAILGLSALVSILLFAASIYNQETRLPIGIAVIFLLLGLIPASEIVITVIHCFISRFVRPTRFPKLEIRDGIPEELATMVIVPTLVPNVSRTVALIDNLEVFYLANRGKNIYFSLVGDFKDSDGAEMPGDADIVDAAMRRVQALNQKYANQGQPVFYFFCRERKYNQNQNKWMGWERKRGAIVEFNRLLRGDLGTSYIYCSTPPKNLPHIKYVITLDADTQLPLETANQLVGTMAHPLNRAVFDVAKGIVTAGYGILQPRINVSIESASVSLFTKIYAGQGGIDPYTTAVSDVYQDAFGEGIFTGKGIYDVDIFARALNDRIPENAVLSHDLLEGCILRAGLVTDVELLDGYPAKYNSFMMRLHRWTRGDWQLLPWIMGKDSLPALSRWKMADNLRRSLLYPVTLVMFLLAIISPGSRASGWLWLILAALCAPVVGYVIHVLIAFDHRTHIIKRSATIITGFQAVGMQLGLILCFAPYQAFLLTHAIFKTLYRVLFTKKNLIEWVTAADMELALKNDAASYYRRMWFSPVYGLACLLPGIYLYRGYTVLGAICFAVWTLAPLIAYAVSRPVDKSRSSLDEKSLNELRILARKTWCYFDEFAGAGDNYLPVDNYQLDPFRGAARRTSPTNIGLHLASNLAARDMGYIGTLNLIKRISQTIGSIEKMDKWNGHLYNWYNTATLEVLKPRFISTVDSGNFAGYLMVLIEGLEEYRNKPLYDISMIEGLFDLLLLCNEEMTDKSRCFDTELLKKLIQAEKPEDSYKKLVDELSLRLEPMDNNPSKGYWHKKLRSFLKEYREAQQQYKGGIFEKPVNIPAVDEEITALQKRIQCLFDNMHFKGLFDPARNLFTIGYDVEEGHASKSHYDLFASEARQASLIAIAKGEIKKQHWFKLGRKLIRVNGSKGLVSWTGTMFEYLMPRLLIKSFPDTLIGKTYEFVVKTQIKYAEKRGIPWGVSESCFYAFDMALNYQYRAFGVPQLGLKRGLANDCVIAPYASIMAVDLVPEECVNNIRRFRDLGAEGDFGLYEAIDFSETRLDLHQNFAVVKSYMVHHQGMSLLALVNFFKNNIMQQRFHRNPCIAAADILLQEKFPANAIVSNEYREQPYHGKRRMASSDETVIREYTHPAAYPNMHILSNGSYYVMLTDKGNGYGRLNSMDVYRWTQDYLQSSGAFIFVRNINSNEYWSATFSPTNIEPEAYKVVFSPHKAEYIRKEGNIETSTEVSVSSEDNTEIRRVTIHNHSSSSRIIELTSYMEVVLSQPEADAAHPAFNKLFVQTEYIDRYNGLLAVRRKREDIKQTVWGYHVVSADGDVQGAIEYETDRSRFIGRNRSIHAPLVMEPDEPLSNSAGPVLDPVLSLRIRILIEGGKKAVVNFASGACESRAEACELLEKYRDIGAADRVIEMAWTRSIVETGFINVSAKDERLYLKLMPQLLYGINRCEQAEYIVNNRLGQSDLWPLGISGDLPLVLTTIESRDSFEEIQWILKLHDYYRIKGIIFDLVILLMDEESYTQPLFDMIWEMVVSGHGYDCMDKRGGLFIRNAKQLDSEQKNLLYAAAKIVVHADRGIADLIERIETTEKYTNSVINPPRTMAVREDGQQSWDYSPSRTEQENLQFFNGFGGFSGDGNEYVICLKGEQKTPLPWVNVIANDHFGFICTESGGGYTWYKNSSQNKLTPWINDPVTDTPSEILYLQDRKSGDVWSITSSPIREREEYIIRHGFGYTCYRHNSHGIEQELIQFCALNAPVKICLVTLKNSTPQEKELDMAYYLRPVLGSDYRQTSPYIVTGFDSELNTMFIENVYNSDFRGLTAFLSCSEKVDGYTGHRLEFMGPELDPAQPRGMQVCLEGTVGAGLDACAANKVRIKILPGESKKIVFLFGQDTRENAIDLIGRFNNVAFAQYELEKVKENWRENLQQIQVSTPDASMNIMLNGWFLYQAISCRIWARTGYYQAGGAFGFRDQLQDVMAVVHTLPEITRNQILLHCRHQFIEGDVQHWWHDQKSNGIRTRYSDDLLWLPYVTWDYINITGDYDILKAEEPYLESEILGENEHERYEVPRISEIKESVYRHCLRAIDKALKFGVHGIPLMGGGDWNDGMNLVGSEGKGESVWLGWFLTCVLKRMIPLCRHMGEDDRAAAYEESAENIIKAIEKEAWDGSWYRRAYFDDGSPLGSIRNDEGKIDSLSQSWAAITGAASKSRALESMAAIEKHLVDRKNGLIKLLTPPFYEGALNPGYIKGYLPGVRENGGQYTHAATWVIYAFSSLADGEKAWEMFNMINPVNHARTNTESLTYKTEPYVLAADVYSVYPNEGRGGWTWYTGAAGWMYRIGIEHLLGIKRQGNKLFIAPCLPDNIEEYSVVYRFGKAVYNIKIQNKSRKNDGVKQLSIDGRVVDDTKIILTDADAIHHVEIIF